MIRPRTLGEISGRLRAMASDFPSMKAKQLLKALGRLGYVTTKHNGGSHRWLECEGRPAIRFAFHDSVEIPARTVKKVLMKQAGLTEDEAREIM